MLTCSRMILFYFSFLLDSTHSLRITRISVPSTVQADVVGSVILDCEYELEDAEKMGLVVKWYFNGQHDPVYQWIPSQPPQDLGLLKGKVNLGYRASSDAYEAYRAIEIVRPTTDLTGNYSCRISTFEEEQALSKRMVVYAPPKIMKLDVKEHTRDRKNVTCNVYEVFPEPIVTLSLVQREANGRIELDASAQAEFRRGRFSVSAYKTLPDNDFPKGTLIECLMQIPGTDYLEKKWAPYFTDKHETKSNAFYSSSTMEKIPAMKYPFVGILTRNTAAEIKWNGKIQLTCLLIIAVFKTSVKHFG